MTLAGESAGAFNVISLMGSSLAAGLFHHAIALSPLNSFQTVSKQKAYQQSHKALVSLLIQDGTVPNKNTARRFLRHKSDEWIAAYLRSKSAQVILSTSTKLSAFGFNELGITTQAFGGSRIADHRLIPVDFQTRFESGHYNRVPLIIGSNTEEAKIFELAFGVFSKPDARELCNSVQAFDPTISDAVQPNRKSQFRFGTAASMASLDPECTPAIKV